MRDGKPWPDTIVDNTYYANAASWELFDDLKKTGITTTKPLTLAFLIYDMNGEVVGDAGIQTVNRGVEAEIHFNIMPKFRRKGIGYTASRFLIEFFKAHFKGDKIAATVMPHNKASQGLLKKLGMKPKCDKVGKPMTYRHPQHHSLFDIYIMSVN
jgi:RimJ/RimL family protein N-acetyltransferase